MKELTIKEKYSWFKESFSHCGLFLLELDDEDILYHLFEEFDSFAISFLHSATLEPLRENRYISDKIVCMCQSLRDKYFKLGINNNKMWSAAEIKNSSEWLDLLRLADEINALLTK